MHLVSFTFMGQSIYMIIRSHIEWYDLFCRNHLASVAEKEVTPVHVINSNNIVTMVASLVKKSFYSKIL